MTTKKLYLVKCRGMQRSSIMSSHTAYGTAYVIADNPTEAYAKVRKRLDDGDLGFPHERELESIELIAEEYAYPDCGICLYA